ncbi:MAG: class I SAM-dependent methyltransferase [Bacteroidales bacterium]|nr:class I SAM-dependent methyltransferase [Bacteroidales bacterium]
MSEKIFNQGQDSNNWSEAWRKLTPDSEIHMRDFYGGRQYLCKYIPRYGKTLEAGCGLGRWVFYFSKMGINITGLDFSESAIKVLNEWSKKNNYHNDFIYGDVTNLPFGDNSIRGYISLGIIEHFLEGPQKPIVEAKRVLEPRGIAIFSTPNISWNIYIRKRIKDLKKGVKRVLGLSVKEAPFFQHYYSPRMLKKYVENEGFIVTVSEGADLLYPFVELGGFTGNNIKPGSLEYWLSKNLENSILRRFGAQSIVIAIKSANKMHCFLCGEFTVPISSLIKYSVPICDRCQNKNLTQYYVKNSIPTFSAAYIINPPIKMVEDNVCDYCGKNYKTDKLFENFGFNKNVCPQCLTDIEINIDLSNKFIQPVWRKRG